MNADDMRIAHHEAVHVCADLHYGRRVEFVARGRHHGLTSSLIVLGDDLAKTAMETAVMVLAPFFEDPHGCDADLLVLDGLLAAGVSLSAVWEKAAKLVTDPEFRRRVRVVEAAMWEHSVLTGEEVELILAAS